MGRRAAGGKDPLAPAAPPPYPGRTARPETTMRLSLALAHAPESWEAFRAEVGAACRASVRDPGKVAVEVRPSGSKSYSLAPVTLRAEGGTDRMASMATKAAELTAPFHPAAE